MATAKEVKDLEAAKKAEAEAQAKAQAEMEAAKKAEAEAQAKAVKGKVVVVANTRLYDPHTKTHFPKDEQVTIPEMTSWVEAQVVAGLMSEA